MTDEIKNPETNATNTTESANTGNTTDECRWNRCRPFGRPFGSEKGDCHGKRCCKKKAILGIVAIALLAFFAGKSCSHHHAEHQRMGYMEQPAVTQSFNGQVQQMPLSTVLDGIAATPDQRAKAVTLLH